MPRSSRSKSHKHSSKEVKEYSDSEEEVKVKGKEEVSVSVRDLASGDKRKIDGSKRRWNAGVEERNHDLKSRTKSSRRHDSAIERKEDTFVDKEESKRLDSKRKSEKEHGRKEHREVKEKDNFLKHSVHVNEEPHGKRGRENTEWPVQNELRNPELEKELEKRTRRKGDGYGDKEKFQDDAIDYDDKRSSRGERTKDMQYKDERHGDKYNEDGDKYIRHNDDKYQEDEDKGSRHRDAKYREDGEKDDKYRDAKHRENGDQDNTYADDKYREGDDHDKRQKDDKYREDGGRTRRREDKYHEYGDKDDRHREDKHKEERHRGNVDRDSKHRDAKQRNDSDRDKRSRDVKYRDEYSSRERISESERKRLRDENNAVDLHHRKSSNHNISPGYDDQGSRYKDDKGNKLAFNKEDHNDVRLLSTKEQHFDTEMRSVNGKVDMVTDRGGSNFRNADVNATLNHSRRRDSPGSSTHASRDNYRVSKPEESKYRDYGYEERIRHNVSSNRDSTGAKQNEKLLSSRPMEKSVQKDDSQFDELSAERRPRSDARASPRMMDISPSSATTDRRHLNRSDVRRAIDIEDSGQRSGGHRDYTRKASRELPMDTHAITEFSQADGDHSSGSSPFARNNFSGSSRSILLPPPPPFRTGDSPFGFGSSEDDNRGRFNNRQRRIADPNMSRSQGNSWKGLPNWPSPVANGYIPFQHGPAPVGFPVMQQFSAPPIFGVRPGPTMDLNHNLPYPMSDADRFPSHGRPLGWRNSVDDSCAPPLHGWDGNNSVFGDDTHAYGRSDWEKNRTQMGNRGWDAGGDMWKGQNSGLSTDLTSAPQKEDFLHPTADEVLAGQQAQIEKKQQNVQDDSLVVQFSDALHDVTSEDPESRENSMISVEDDFYHYNVYLSKFDISTDLTEPKVYDRFTSLMDLERNTFADDDYFNILYVEEALEARVADTLTSNTFLAATSDSVFQKAMSLYEKQKGEIGATNRERVPSPILEDPKVVQDLDNEKSALNDGNSGAHAPNCDGQQVEEALVDYKEHIDLSRGSEACEVTAGQKLDEPSVIDNLVASMKQVKKVNVTEMEVDPVSIPEVQDIITESKSMPLQNVEPSDGLLPANIEEMQCGSPVVGHCAKNEQKLIESKSSVPLLISDVSGEAVMPESIECGSVNLSRIHHSPESTH